MARRSSSDDSTSTIAVMGKFWTSDTRSAQVSSGGRLIIRSTNRSDGTKVTTCWRQSAVNRARSTAGDMYSKVSNTAAESGMGGSGSRSHSTRSKGGRRLEFMGCPACPDRRA